MQDMQWCGKSGHAQQNVQKNTKDTMNWRDQNPNIYNIYSKNDQQEWEIDIKSMLEYLCMFREKVAMPSRMCNRTRESNIHTIYSFYSTPSRFFFNIIPDFLEYNNKSKNKIKKLAYK